MAEGRTHVSEIFFKRESAYATTETGSAMYQRMIAGSFKPDLRINGESLPDERVVPTAFEEEDHLFGTQYGGKVGLEVYGEGLAAGLNGGATYGSPNNSPILLVRSAFGASHGNKGSLVEAAGTTTSAVQHTAGDAANFDEGMVIGVTTASGPGGANAIEPALIRKKVGDVLHLWTTLASVPSAGSVIYGAETCYFSPAAFGGDGESLYAEFVGENAEDQFKVRGIVPTSMKIVMGLRALMKLQFDMSVNNATRVNSLSISRTAPTGGHPLTVANRHVYIGDNVDADAVIARSLHSLEDLVIDTGMEVSDEPGDGVGAVETLYRKRLLRARPTGEITFRLSRSSTTYASYYTERAARTKKYVHAYVGDSVGSSGFGGIVFMAMPRCRYDMHIQRSDADGFSRATVKLGATRPRSYSGGVQAVMDSPMVFAVL